MNQNQNINVSQETIQRVLGEKEMIILVLRSRVEELEKELESLKNPVDEKSLRLAN